MKLERFVKNKKQKRICIGSMVGLLLILGGVKLYKTFAIYEVKKEFNVLRGRIPAFSNSGDVKFAALVDDVGSNTIPTKTDGKTYVGYECNKPGVTIEWNNDKWGPLTLGLTEKGTSCTLKFKSIPTLNDANIGDYIAYTPSNTSYTITTAMTGYSSNQIINPSELNLWRVIRKNDDGTIDAVSEYVSSESIYFAGTTGYNSYRESLNTIAKQYETPSITVSSRHIGFTGDNNSECGIDCELIENAVGSLIALEKKSMKASEYWVPKLLLIDPVDNDHSWYLGCFDAEGNLVDMLVQRNYHPYYGGGHYPRAQTSRFRVIMTFEKNVPTKVEYTVDGRVVRNVVGHQ